MNKASEMRRILDESALVVLPGVYDALGARIVEEAGFNSVYMSGWCVEASYAKPDMGLLTMTEMVSRATSIVEAVDIPVFCDADTGYGNAVNVIRTVREFERGGIAGIHLEDQESPKRCGQFSGRRLISMEEMVGKIKAALDARTDPDFIIMARTDAIDMGGIKEVIRRAQAYIDAGADLIWPIMHHSATIVEDIKSICSSLSKPMMVSLAEGGVQPTLPFSELSGVKLVLLPTTLTFCAITAMRHAAREIKWLGMQLNDISSIWERNDSWDQVVGLVGLNRVLADWERFGPHK